MAQATLVQEKLNEIVENEYALDLPNRFRQMAINFFGSEDYRTGMSDQGRDCYNFAFQEIAELLELAARQHNLITK